MRRARSTCAAIALTLVLVAALGATAASGAGRCGTHPWCDRSLSADRRVTLLLPHLTLQEKLGLMGGDDSSGFLHAGHSSGTELGVPRLGIPPLYLTDGPSGVREGIGDEKVPATALPAPLALAASFDPRLAYRYGALIAGEAKHHGDDVSLGPTMNIVRVPRGGRSFESYGEDPYLTGQMAIGFIHGEQADGVIATAKHYAANNQESGRLTVNVVAGERTLREIYLPHFEAAVREGGVGVVMSAYNKVNGAYSGANRPLLHDLLMRAFGFRGFVVSDWFAGGDTVGSANAGQSLVMPGEQYYSPTMLSQAIAAGRISVATIDGLVSRYLRTLFRFGVFDRQAYPRDLRIPVRAHGLLARDVEAQAIVLLKNGRRALPLDARRIHSIAVIGKPAAAYQQPGAASSADVKPYYDVTLLDGIRRRAGRRIDVRFDDGADAARAARVASAADVAVVGASPSHESGEFLDRPCLALDCPPDPETQDATIRAVAAANRRTVVVLQSPGPVLMPWVADVSAIVEGWEPGEEGGNALAAALFGDVDPSGKLPVTYPRREADTPASTPAQFPGVGGRALYSEGLEVGYRHYDARHIAPLFPFGHGLSYTRFRYRHLSLRRLGDGRYRVSVSVRNVGRRAGAEVAQLYLGLPAGLGEPPKRLVGFERVPLRPGHSTRIVFRIGARAFSWWDSGVHDWRVSPGCYPVLVGSSSRDIRERTRVARGGSRCPR